MTAWTGMSSFWCKRKLLITGRTTLCHVVAGDGYEGGLVTYAIIAIKVHNVRNVVRTARRYPTERRSHRSYRRSGPSCSEVYHGRLQMPLLNGNRWAEVLGEQCRLRSPRNRSDFLSDRSRLLVVFRNGKSNEIPVDSPFSKETVRTTEWPPCPWPPLKGDYRKRSSTRNRSFGNCRQAILSNVTTQQMDIIPVV